MIACHMAQKTTGFRLTGAMDAWIVVASFGPASGCFRRYWYRNGPERAWELMYG